MHQTALQTTEMSRFVVKHHLYGVNLQKHGGLVWGTLDAEETDMFPMAA